MKQSKSWLLKSPLKGDKPTINLVEEKKKWNIKEKVVTSKHAKEMKRPVREYHTQPLVGTVVCYPDTPFRTGRLIPSLWRV